MSGLKLGDLILDSRRVVYLPSLKAVVCAGLHEALSIGIAEGLRGVLERVDAILEHHKPENFIILGRYSDNSPLTGIVRRWGRKTKIVLVSDEVSPEARELAEALGCEVHQELIWDRYRFVESEKDGALELQLQTIIGRPNYGIRVGKTPFGGMKLAVFLKGLGRVFLPHLGLNAPASSVFGGALDRYDVFAVGHQRVLPMGKVSDLKSVRGMTRSLPLAKATLGARRGRSYRRDKGTRE